MNKAWVLGLCLFSDDGEREIGWMCEGIFKNEEDAKKHAQGTEFIALVNFNSRLPEKAEDVEKLYWPNQEKCYEDSKHYQMTKVGGK